MMRKSVWGNIAWSAVIRSPQHVRSVCLFSRVSIGVPFLAATSREEQTSSRELSTASSPNIQTEVELLVDGDTNSIDEIRSARLRLQQEGYHVKATKLLSHPVELRTRDGKDFSASQACTSCLSRTETESVEKRLMRL